MRQAAAIGGPLLLIGALAWPLLFTDSAFTGDWLNYLWFMWHESLTIRADHLPSLFLNHAHGVFYPEFAFYGGTLYALVGTLSLALGDAPLQTYILTFLLAFAAAYGGWYWIARLAGLRGWPAHAPGVVFITSAYYLTLIYVRGDWPELIGVSTIPLMVAAGLSVLRAERLRLAPALALVGSAVMFFGSHNITMLWGSTLLVLLGLALMIAVPQARRAVTRRGVARVAGLVVPALLVNAWYLLPAVAYASQTFVAKATDEVSYLLYQTSSLVDAGHLFTLSRASASFYEPAFALSLPILVIAWVLIGGALLARRGASQTWLRILLILSCLTLLTGIFMTHVGLILALPSPYAQVEFGYRLESYILLGISGAVLAVLVLARGAPGRAGLWMPVLLPVLCVSVVGAIQQTAAYPPYRNASRAFALRSYLETPLPGERMVDYIDAELPLISITSLPVVDFPPTAVHHDRVSTLVHLSSGELAYSNLFSGPSLVHVSGARIVGVGPTGASVLEIAPTTAARSAAHGGGATPSERISVTAADSFPVVAGRLLTLAAVLALVAQFTPLALRRRLR